LQPWFTEKKGSLASIVAYGSHLLPYLLSVRLRWIFFCSIASLIAVKGAASFTIYSSTKEYFRKQKYFMGNNMFDVAASGAVGGALAGALITFGSVRE
jgi:hypothetical protein